MIERGIFPTKNYVENISIGLLDPHLLKLFLAKGLRPSQKSIDDYYQKYTGRYANLRTFQSKIELLLETKLLPGEKLMKTLLGNEQFEILDYLVANGCKPARGAWFSLAGLKITQEDANTAIRRSDLDALSEGPPSIKRSDEHGGRTRPGRHPDLAP